MSDNDKVILNSPDQLKRFDQHCNELQGALISYALQRSVKPSEMLEIMATLTASMGYAKLVGSGMKYNHDAEIVRRNAMLILKLVTTL